MAFTTPSYSLTDLFARINRGELQLPDFQRSYSWNVDQIHAVIITVLRGYPIGALLALDTRNEPKRFQTRVIDGAPETGNEPGLLLLDGQQRLTSIYRAFQGSGYVDTVDFRNKKITRRFFVDVLKAVEGEVVPDDAVFSVNENGYVRSHFAPEIDEPLTSMEAELRAGVVPVDSLLGQSGADLLFDMAARTEDESLRSAIKRFHHQIVAPLAAYDIPMIRLGRETAQAGVGPIFAQANRAGLPMDVFELLTAVFAIEDETFSLADSCDEIFGELSQYPVLDGISRTDFLSALTLYVTGLRGTPAGQREDILTLTVGDWKKYSPRMVEAFAATAKFLADKVIFSAEQVPFRAQLVPLAAMIALLHDEPQPLDIDGVDKLNRWFWTGVLCELYGSAAVGIRAERDVAQVRAWIREDGEVPKTLDKARFNESRLLSVDENTGVWKGIYALLMARGARDWRTGQLFDAETFGELEPTFQPIFPVNWCLDHGIEPLWAESVLNHTPMGKRTEVVLNNYDPSRYLPRLQSKSIMEDAEFDRVLATHELDPELLHISDAEAFFADRRERVIGMIEYALDKSVVRDIDADNIHGGAEGPDAFAEK